MVIVLSSIDESLIQAHEYSRTPYFSILDPWLSILNSPSWNSNASTFATWELSFEDRVKAVNLPLIGTVVLSFMSLTVQMMYFHSHSLSPLVTGFNLCTNLSICMKKMNFLFLCWKIFHKLVQRTSDIYFSAKKEKVLLFHTYQSNHQTEIYKWGKAHIKSALFHVWKLQWPGINKCPSGVLQNKGTKERYWRD